MTQSLKYLPIQIQTTLHHGVTALHPAHLKQAICLLLQKKKKEMWY